MGSLRRRFVALLVLLALSSLVPWRLASDLHAHLEGFGMRLELASTLRYQTSDLMQLTEASAGSAVVRDAVHRILDAQQKTLTMLIEGDPASGLPACVTPRVCRRLEEHRARWYQEIAPAAWEVVESGHTTNPGELQRDLLGELAQLDGTLHLMADAAEHRVSRIMARGMVAMVVMLVLVALVGYGVGEVFSRIRRLREAAADPAKEAELDRQAEGADEVASLAATLRDSLRSLRRQGEAERLRAGRLDARQRALRSLAAGLNDWIEGEGSLEDLVSGAARDAAYAGAEVDVAPGADDPGAVLPALVPDEAGVIHVRVPLTWGDQRLGTLELVRPDAARVDAPEIRAEALDPDERALVEAFGRTVSIAVVARSLLDEREARTRLAAWLSTQRDMGEGAAALFGRLRRLLAHDTGILAILDDTGAVEQCWRISESGVDAMRTACRLEVPAEVAPLERGARPADLDDVCESEAVLSVPLMVEHRSVGLLLLGRAAPFAPREVEVARTVAPVVASTLERMRLTERLHLSEHLATVGGLSRMVAHEVRNPLNSLGLHARLLEKMLRRVDLDDAEHARLAEHISILRGEVERLDGVVESYVALATGGRSARLEGADLRALVQEALAVYRPRLEARGIDLDVDLGDAPAEALVDRLRLQQAVHNLVCNALEAVEDREGGRIAVTLVRTPDAYALHVRDNGPGLADLRRIFTPGYTTKAAGSGMGLPISLQIARLHGGSLVARRPEGGGTELVLTVARSGAPQAAVAGR